MNDFGTLWFSWSIPCCFNFGNQERRDDERVERDQAALNELQRQRDVRERNLKLQRNESMRRMLDIQVEEKKRKVELAREENRL